MKALIGRPVLMNGEPIGHVTNVELDEALARMNALYVDDGFSGTRRIGGQAVRLLGEVSVLVDDRGKRARPKDNALRRVRTSDGCRVGAVTGALLDEETLEVKALELSRGYFDDLFTGRQWVTRYAINLASGDVLIESEGGTDHEGRMDQGHRVGRAGGRVGMGGGFDDEPAHAQTGGESRGGRDGQGSGKGGADHEVTAT